MRVVTLTCPECRTVVAANVLEERRVMECPGPDCDRRLRFDDLDEDDRRHFLEYRDQYRM